MSSIRYLHIWVEDLKRIFMTLSNSIQIAFWTLINFSKSNLNVNFHFDSNYKVMFMHSKSQHNYAYLPFSLGPRNCIGQNFALMEAKVILAKLVKSFDFVLDPTQNFGVRQKTTLTPFDGARCTILPRLD